MLLSVLLNSIERCFGRFLFRPLVRSKGFLGLLDPFDKILGYEAKLFRGWLLLWLTWDLCFLNFVFFDCVFLYNLVNKANLVHSFSWYVYFLVYLSVSTCFGYLCACIWWIFRKWEGVVGTGWSWLRIGTGGGHLWVRWWTFGFRKMRRISGLATEPVSFSRRTLLYGVSK